MKKQPQKRLGRGLDNLIRGGLQKPTPPSVQIDSMKIIRTDVPEQKANTAPAPTPLAKKKDLLGDLNDLLKKTQAELGADEAIFSNSELPQAEMSDEEISAEAAGAIKDVKKEAPNGHQSNGASVGSGQGVFMLLPLGAIKLSPYQRRKEFSQEALKDLADSIRSEGLMQPIVVRGTNAGYELIAGERRLRACQSIGMEVIPARVVSVQDTSAAVMGLIENLQRENLNPVEEARGYGMLLTDFHMTQEQIAERVGKPRSTVANSLRLMLLEVEILGYLAKGQISLGHAKVLLGLQEGAQRVMLARTVVEQGLSVRQTEALTKKAANSIGLNGSNKPTKRLMSEEELNVVKDLQKKVISRLNAKVSINHTAKGGRMVIYYKSNQELDGILKTLGVE